MLSLETSLLNDHNHNRTKTKMCLFSISDLFEAKYRQEIHLGEGGCGCVYAGYRIADDLPVSNYTHSYTVCCILAHRHAHDEEVLIKALFVSCRWPSNAYQGRRCSAKKK